MRLVVIKQATDLQALGTRLFKKSSGLSEQTVVDRVRALNPHVADFQHIRTGTVLLVPDLPAAKQNESQSVGADAFDSLSNDIATGLKAAAQRVRANLTRLTAEHTEVQGALRSAAIRRVLANDPLLGQQLEAVDKQFATAQKQAQEASKSVEAMQKHVGADLVALRKLLG